MTRIVNSHIRHSLTAQICLWVVFFVAILYIASLFIMFHQARTVIYKEAMEKARQSLLTTELHIDNILSDVETATRNMHWNVEHHLDNPEMMESMCRQLVASNPHIIGCAIAFEPNMYQQYGTYHEVYAYKDVNNSSKVGVAINNGQQPYTHQKWYFSPLHHDKPLWIDPYYNRLNDAESYITSFSMPLHNRDGKPVGILSTDISMLWLSNLILSTRPFPNSHPVVMGSDGHIIIHPDSTFESHEKFFAKASEDKGSEGHLTAISMKTGRVGNSQIHLDNELCHIFYQPFENAGWSVAIVCPDSDIFTSYNMLLRYTIVISLGGLLLVVLFCLYISHRQLKPLTLLLEAANTMAQGQYNTPVKASSRTDEIGYLQNTFRQMQQSIVAHIDRIRQLTLVLLQRNEDLQQVCEQAREAERMKDAFIRNMTDRMEHAVKDICIIVDDFHQRSSEIKDVECQQLSVQVKKHTEVTIMLLEQLLDVSKRSERK